MRDTRETPDIAVVGGGICGLTTALALEQRGFEPTVFEAASEYRPVGAGILLQTNALLVFDRLGVANRLREAGVALGGSAIHAPSGRVLKRLDLSFEREAFGYGFVSIHRADLLRILLDELDAEVRTGKRCVEVRDAETPTVRFEDGTRVHPDVLVGADGIDSTVRNLVAPSVEPRAMDAIVYRAIADVELPEQYRTRGVEVWGEGTYTGGAPLGPDRFYWFGTAPDRLENDPSDPREPAATLRQRFGDFPDPIPSVAEALDPDAVFVTGLDDVPELERWHRGSVVLAGDAAHAMLPFGGQGAAQGVEDALALAHAIDTHGDSSSAFRAYETDRKPRADRIRDESRRLGTVGTIESSLGARARNLAVGLVPSALVRRFRRRRASGTSLPETPVSGSGSGA
ncbi:FAD-dependent oxidoreductase [Halorussus caseinilyticus]|nr:FAD-dependent oxidoreductase [Halorussus sp. DT72]